ncbi:MAG: hypothetical protein LC667_18810, partial [Thioalkalivibrio sp.]|nr:hypothetical protein [Thioalkalivibrio sp.]
MKHWENHRTRMGGARGSSDGQPTRSRPYRTFRHVGALVLAALLTACGTQQLDATIDVEELGALMVVTSTAEGSIAELDGQTVSGSVHVRVETTRSVGEVHFALDDDPEAVAIDATVPFEMLLDTT